MKDKPNGKADESLNYRKILQTVMERVSSQRSDRESNRRKEYKKVAMSILKAIKESRSCTEHDTQASETCSPEITGTSSQVCCMPYI